MLRQVPRPLTVWELEAIHDRVLRCAREVVGRLTTAMGGVPINSEAVQSAIATAKKAANEELVGFGEEPHQYEINVEAEYDATKINTVGFTVTVRKLSVVELLANLSEADPC